MPSQQSLEQSQQRRGFERRRSTRRDVTLGGRLYFGLCGLSIDCVVRDISEHGARVAVPKASWKAPRDVQLLSVREGRLYCGRVVWNRGRYLGLNFTTVHDLNAEVPPEFANMRKALLEMRRA
jgi:hypothetical protein